MLYLPNQAKLFWLDIIKLGFFDSGSFHVALYQNNHVPDPSDTVADYVEATFNGYGALTTGGWTVPSIAAGHAITDATSLQWICSDGAVPNDIYGMIYFNSGGGGQLLAVDRFLDEDGNPDPVAMDAAGKQILRRPIFSLTLES